MDEILERLFEGVEEGWDWLRGVLLGEWQEEKTLDQTVADALLGFVPGVGTMMTLRDLIAVIVRLVRHPERRDDVDQWILLVAMLLPLIITAVGALVAGVGALVGAELGAFMRAVTLFLIKHKGLALKTMIEFFQGHGYGNVVKALQQVKFTSYKNDLLREFGKQIERMERLLNKVLDRLVQLDRLPDWLVPDAVPEAIRRMQHFIAQLHALHAKAHSMLPRALLELDARLNALLAGELQRAMSATHRINTGQSAPAVAKMEQHAASGPNQGAGSGQGLSGPSSENAGVLRNQESPEPGNTRLTIERRLVALHGQREYQFIYASGMPVGAKPYNKGQILDNPAIELDDWVKLRGLVQEGYPDLEADKISPDYANFTRLRPGALPAGSLTTFKRVVGKGRPSMDDGSYYNRELPVDGEDFRANSSVKEVWNNDGEYIELHTPPKGDPLWRELNALQEKSAGRPVPFKEELKFWEGPAASQIYETTHDDGTKLSDDWVLPGGKEQQYFDREQIRLLRERGFVTNRKPTNFPDYDPIINNIIPKEGPFLEVTPATQATPSPRSGTNK